MTADPSPDADPDADGNLNVLEYALATPPESGLQQQRRFSLEANAATGELDAVVIRPTGGRPDLSYTVEALAELTQSPSGWSSLTITPAVTQNGDGTETLRFADVVNCSVFADHPQGFLRIKVALDADLDGVTDSVAVSNLHAWLHREFAATQQTFSMPLLARDVYRGRVSTIDGGLIKLTAADPAFHTTIQPDTQYYAEVLDGALEGHRFDLDESTATADSVAVDLASQFSTLPAVPTELAGCRIAIRPHWTIGSLFPAEQFTASSEVESADRLLFFDRATSAFQVAWLQTQEAGPSWSGASHSQAVVPPGQGMFVHPRTNAVTLLYTGEVRTNAFVQPLVSGAQLLGSVHPVYASPASLGLTTSNGLAASTTAITSARVQLWRGDVTPGSDTYRGLFHMKTTDGSAWVDELEPTLDETAAPMVAPAQSYFLLPTQDLPAHRVPLPWQP